MKSVLLHTFAKNALLAFAALCIVPFADAKHEKDLPAETIFVAQIADASDLSKRFSAHPLAIDIAAIVKKYSAHRKAQSAGEKQTPAKTGISDEMFQEAEEILKQYCGKEILIGAVKTPANAGQDAPPFSFVLLTDVLDAQEIQPDFLDLICQLFEKEVPYPATGSGDFAAIEINSETQGFARPAKTITSTFQGITLHELERTLAKGKTVNRGGWALVNKTIVFATTPNALRELVDTVQNGRKSNFADTTAWKRALARSEE
ncbi:MAG: hypothetical protein LBV28_03240, partial [Puniceicoccales bacterium]|nr:hypothetical protein [Puniceicoccales bacterium]